MFKIGSRSRKYRDNLETLVALTTNLAMSKYKSRTPTVLADDLSLNYDDVLHNLKTFKSIFRESDKVSKKEKEPSGEPEHFYWLQLRYARWYLENKSEDDGKLEPPLGSEYLVSLLDFIVKMVDQENSQSRNVLSNLATLVGAIFAFIAAILAAFIALTGT